MHTIYFDIETATLSTDHPRGWGALRDFGFALAVTWDEINGFRTFYNARELYEVLIQYNIISFNGLRFDNIIVAHEADRPVEILNERTFDILADLHRLLGHRVSLQQLAEGTLKTGKAGSATESVEWWQAAVALEEISPFLNHTYQGAALLGAGALKEQVERYCRRDVKILRDIHLYGQTNGAVLYAYRGAIHDCPVDWT